jgi:thiol-disulfide isomerase/thioredoxin
MTRTTRMMALVTALALAPGGATIMAQTGSTSFYPASDATHEIEAALAAAARDGKYVLLDFGADWCPDCRVLGGLFEDPTVAAVVQRSFHVVRIDVGRRDKNADLVKTYGATSGDWIPALVVVDGARHTIATTDDKVRVTRKTSAAELRALLLDWAPKALVASLGSFHQGGVRVDIRLERDVVHQPWLSAAFIPERPDTHLYATDLPPQGLDGLGRPTRLAVVSAQGLVVTGGLVVDRPVAADLIEALHLSLPVYPAGPVTLRLPVRIEPRATAEVSVSYMACGGIGCQPPVTDRRVSVVLPPIAHERPLE